MKKITLLMLLLFYTHIIISQNETCESSDENLLSDLNSITKCSIEKSEEKSKDKLATKNISVVVSSRRRVVRNRDAVNGVINKNHDHEINKINSKNNITKKLNLEYATTNTNMPFNVVEEIPLFKKCESSPILQQKQCFKKELSNHIKKNLKYPEYAYEKAIQGRVLIYFLINKDGSIGKIKATPPYQGDLLAEEATRIINKLPNFKPAKHNGSNVITKYALPISFTIPGTQPSNIRKKVTKKTISNIYTFNQVGTIPLFKTCRTSQNTSMSCFNTQLAKYIQDNFAYPQVAVDKNIKGIVNVKFVIDKKGNVINIETKGPQNGEILETAAKVLIRKLPKFSPATINGKPTNVTYNFPVNFELN